MGRRLRGAALRSKKRSTEAAQEIVQSTAVQAEHDAVRKQADDDLFVIDTTATAPTSKRQQLKKEQGEKRRSAQLASAKEQAQVQKLVDTHSANELKKLAERSSRTARHAKVKGTIKPTFDLWGEQEDEEGRRGKKNLNDRVEQNAFVKLAGIVPASHVPIGTTKALPAPKLNTVSLDLAISGQSYNPDKKDHQIAIEEAIMVETKRELADKEHHAPISQGLSKETRALILGDSDTESDDDSDCAEEDRADASTTIPKRPEKLTRAQRNKQKRVRAELTETRERKRQKKLQTAAGQAKTISKQLKKEEDAQKGRKVHLEKLKADQERVKGKNVYQHLAKENPRFAPTYPVALPEELRPDSSLRTLKPKGSLVTDRMVSMMDRDMTAKKQLKKKMRVEGNKRKLKVRGKGYEATMEGDILG
jgi:nucleolar protein 53